MIRMEKLIPMGSIVQLKKGTQKLMVLNRGAETRLDGKEQFFDYSGCLYPIGLIANKVFYFNAENIDKVVFEGFSDEEEIRFQDLYEKWFEVEGKNIEKGEVKQALKD